MRTWMSKPTGHSGRTMWFSVQGKSWIQLGAGYMAFLNGTSAIFSRLSLPRRVRKMVYFPANCAGERQPRRSIFVLLELSDRI